MAVQQALPATRYLSHPTSPDYTFIIINSNKKEGSWGEKVAGSG